MVNGNSLIIMYIGIIKKKILTYLIIWILGDQSVSSVIIDSNDDANGIFCIYSNDPRFVSDRSHVIVEERDHYSVQLIVEREGEVFEIYLIENNDTLNTDSEF